MGISHVIILKDSFEITVDIDHSVTIEMGTGFGSSSKPSVNLTMPVSIEELGNIIDNLKEIHTELLNSKTCYFCNKIILSTSVYQDLIPPSVCCGDCQR